MSKKTIKILTLVLPVRGDKVLLGMKKRGFGIGRWNGFGGKPALGESIEEAARRELLEESGLVANRLEKLAIHSFEFENDPVILETHTFVAADFSGRPKETEEMRPKWFLKNEPPFDEMWPDDRFWLPTFLSGKKARNWFLFKNQNEIIEKKIEFVDNFPEI